ncbi:MAG: hypothetical protein WCX31_02040 [Salinivirgaceae bacterium]
MKANLLSMILMCCLVVLFISSCESNKKQPDDAYDKIKEERMLLADTNFISKEIIQESMQTEPIKVIKKSDEWTIFENEIGLKITMNEKIIAEIKEKRHPNFFFHSKLKSLIKENNNLKNALNEFNEETKLRWATFKTTMVSDANRIGIELNVMKDEKKK